jgi:hypothetical protein
MSYPALTPGKLKSMVVEHKWMAALDIALKGEYIKRIENGVKEEYRPATSPYSILKRCLLLD